MPARDIVAAHARHLYHATTADFDRFEVGRPGKNSWALGAWPVKRAALFFTPNPKFAGEFIADLEHGGYRPGARVHRVQLDLQKPLRLDRSPDLYALAEKTGINAGWLTRVAHHWELFDGEDGRQFVTALRALGYDGAIFTEDDGKGRPQKTYAVFDPAQVRPVGGGPPAGAPG